MKKSIWVVFTNGNARISKEPVEGALKNPDLSRVRGLPPHFWKLVDGRIEPMSRPEKKFREARHRVYGVENDLNIPAPTVMSHVRVASRLSAMPLIWMSVGALILWGFLNG